MLDLVGFGVVRDLAVLAQALGQTLGEDAEQLDGRALFRALWPVAVIFGVVMGGIYGGLFTPTEGAAIGLLIVQRNGVSPDRAELWRTWTGTPWEAPLWVACDALRAQGYGDPITAEEATA